MNRRSAAYITGLSLSGGILSPSFNINQTHYVIHTTKATQTLDFMIPIEDPDVKVTVVGAAFIDTDAVYHIDITNLSEFTIQVTNIEGTVIKEKYHFSINPWIGFATSNAQGKEVILSFKEALDLSSITANHFTLSNTMNNALAIDSVTYDTIDLNHPTVHLKLAETLTD